MRLSSLTPLLASLISASLTSGCAALAQTAAPPVATAVTAAAEPEKVADAAVLADAPLAYRKHILANGLTLLVREDHKAPLVSVQVWYHVGSQDEQPGKTGFAHLFEHLMFNGSAHHDDEFFRPLEAAGASLINGTTSNDRTNFYETVPTGALDLALWLESDRMGHLLPAVTQAKLDEQRGVVKNEKRQREEQPYGRIDELLSKALYPPGHPYSWTTIGSMADLDAASLADVHAWFKRYYGPNNATLVLAGDISFEDAVARSEKFFGAIPAGPAVERPTAISPPLAAPARQTVFDKVTQPRLYRVWNIPAEGHPDSLLLNLVGDVLAGDKAGRLYRRLVTKEPLATAVSAGVDDGLLGSQFQIVISLKPEADLQAAEAALDDELRRIATEPPTAGDLSRIKTSLYVQRLAGRESVAGQAAELASCQVFRGSPEACNEDWRQLMAATPELLRAAAARWLGPQQLTLTVLPEPQFKAGTSADADRRALPASSEPAGIQLPPLQRFSLSNGIEVLLAERHETPLVRMSLFWPWGTAAQPGAGQLEMLLGMLSEGAAGLSAEKLTESYGNLGAQFGVDVDADAIAVQLSAVRPRLAESLQLFARNLRQPDFPADALARRQARKLASLRANTASPGGILGLNQYRLMYGSHPYGRYNSLPLLEASTRALSSELLRALAPRFLRPDGARLLVVGDVDAATLKTQLEASLGDWAAPALPKPDASLPAISAPPPRVFLFDKPGSEQALIAAADLAPPAGDPQREAMELANAVLGGLFTSRLNMNLREDKHWTYGASTGLGEAVGPALFYVQAAVETAHTAEAMREARNEIAALAGARPPTAAELDAARKSLVRALPGEAETAAGVLGLYQRLLVYGLPLDHYAGYATRLAALDGAAVAKAAQQLARAPALSWFVVGDLAKIEASVRALKLGPVTVMDAEGKVLR